MARLESSPNTSLDRPRDSIAFRVLVYVRVSIDDEYTGSHTFETQRERIRERLDKAYGTGTYTTEEYIDNGVSGAYGPEPTPGERRTRPGLKQALDKLKSRNYDALAVYDLSRLARNNRWFEQIVEDYLIPYGVRLIVAAEDIDISTDQGRIVASVTSLVNAGNRNAIRRRNRDAAASRANLGFLVGRPGYGWRWAPPNADDPKQRRGIEPVPEKAEWVVKIKDWYLSGWGTMRIVKELNRLGVPAPSGKGPWRFNVVLNVLRNPLHAGYVEYRGELIRGVHFNDRFYDIEDYRRILEIGTNRLCWAKTNTAKAVEHLLNGIVCCARCGGRLYMSFGSDATYRTYSCKNGHNTGKRTCPDLTVRADLLEEAVVAEVLALASNPRFEAMLAEESQALITAEEATAERDLERVKARLASLEAQFTNWADQLTKGLVTDDQFRGFNEKLLLDKAALETERDALAARLSDNTRREEQVARVRVAMKDVAKAWDHLDLEQRRHLVATILDKLAVDRHGKEVSVTLQIAGMPEKTLTLTMIRKKRCGHITGLAAVTPRQLALLYHLRQGKTLKEAGEAMGIGTSGLYTLVKYLRHHCGVYNMEDAVRMMSPRINKLLPQLPLGPDPKRKAPEDRPLLSAKLMDVFPMLAAGATSPEVAKALGLSVITVNGRRAVILRRLNANSIYEAARKAREMGMLE